MTQILIALATAAGVLLPTVILVVVATMTAVRRAEAEAHHAIPGLEAAHAHDSAGAEPVGSVPARELSVMEILLLAVALFAVSMLALLGVSLIGHL